MGYFLLSYNSLNGLLATINAMIAVTSNRTPPADSIFMNSVRALVARCRLVGPESSALLVMG